jgi:small-conductance mechanosensitive channel
MTGVTLPDPPEGYEYKLVSIIKKPRIKDKDPSELTPRQRATLKYQQKNKEKLAEYGKEYREKNREKIAEQSRQKYQEKKVEEKVCQTRDYP